LRRLESLPLARSGAAGNHPNTPARRASILGDSGAFFDFYIVAPDAPGAARNPAEST
jgi:hypothetical protein